jgi:hypothetical protein
MSHLSRLERWGILTGIATGITGFGLSILTLAQAYDVQNRTNAQQRAEQASLVVAELYPGTSRQQARVMVENYSNLPVYRLSVIGPASQGEVGTLPRCSAINVTSMAETSRADLPSGDGVPPIALEYTDADGIVWYRLGAKAPHRGRLPASEQAEIQKDDGRIGQQVGITVNFGLESATPMSSCG